MNTTRRTPDHQQRVIDIRRSNAAQPIPSGKHKQPRSAAQAAAIREQEDQ